MTFQITEQDYFTGPGKVRRDQCYAGECSDEIRANAQETVRRANLLLFAMAKDGVTLAIDPQTGSLSHSGWRPAAVNAATKGAAPKSNHMNGKACDLYDPNGKLDAWCLSHLDVLASIGLWMEHPDNTPLWCHVQIVPPGSGHRVFMP